MNYNTSDIASLLKKGESEVLEYKRDVSPAILAKLVSAFANSYGGLILVGVDDDPRHYSTPTIIGTNSARLEKIYKSTLDRVTPKPKTILSIVTVNDKNIGVIEVEKSDRLIVSDEGVFNRTGTSTQVMSPSSIVQVVRRSDEQDQLEVMAKSISQLTQSMEEMKTKLDDSGSWRNKAVDYTLGGIAGAIISLILAVLL